MTNASPIPEYVTDTIGLVLYLEKRKLTPQVKQIFQDTEKASTVVFIPAIVFAEILYLSEKNRIHTSLRDVFQHLQKYDHFKEFPLTLAVMQAAAQINDVPELHDRLIAATARLQNAPLITNDLIIQASKSLQTVW